MQGEVDGCEGKVPVGLGAQRKKISSKTRISDGRNPGLPRVGPGADQFAACGSHHVCGKASRPMSRRNPTAGLLRLGNDNSPGFEKCIYRGPYFAACNCCDVDDSVSNECPFFLTQWKLVFRP
jgi:hypothetical protein